MWTQNSIWEIYYGSYYSPYVGSMSLGFTNSIDPSSSYELGFVSGFCGCNNTFLATGYEGIYGSFQK